MPLIYGPTCHSLRFLFLFPFPSTHRLQPGAGVECNYRARRRRLLPLPRRAAALELHAAT
jgi:hypothetical protein